MTISAVLLARDDASTLRACLESIRPHVDELVILDTGSTDDSERIAREFADRWERWTGCNDSEGRIEDFAAARNHAKTLASGDFHFWCDADDVVVGAENLRKLAAQRQADNQVWLIPYDYQFDGKGNCTCVHWRENLVYPLAKQRWHSPVHEYMVNESPVGSIVTVPTTLVRRVHRKAQSTRPPEPRRNLRILEKYYKRVGETDVRALYYYGVELSMAGEIGEALRILRRYTQLSNWGDERCLAFLEIARIQQEAIRDQESAVEWAQKAMITKSWDAPYWIISAAYYDLAIRGIDEEQNFRRCAHFAQLGLKIPPAETVLFTNPTRRHEIHYLLNVALCRIGDIQGARDSCALGLQGLPGDAGLTQNLKIYESELGKREVLSGLEKLHRSGHLDRHFADHVIKGLNSAVSEPAALPALPPAVPSLALAPRPPVDAQPAAPGCLDVVFLLGPQYEPWNPITLAQNGMGGSETMAWEMARRLRALGHRVRLYAQATPEQEGVFDGVEYLDTMSRVEEEIRCDVAIVSRNPTLLDLKLTARMRLLWVHDVHVGDALTPARALRFDRILCLSEWHKAFMLGVYCEAQQALVARLHPDDIRVTRNGIDAASFGYSSSLDRDKCLVYSSSPDRGLQTLLEMWPAILREEPEAELHCFYGWSNWEKSIAMGLRVDIPWLSAEALRQIKHMIATLPNVTMHGRVGPKQLNEEFLRSGVWAYPTWFAETSCITAMQAQAAGCYVVTTPVAALNETVADRGVMVRGAWENGQVAGDAERAEFVRAVVNAIRGVEQLRSRQELREYAREHFDLDALARDWDAMLREELAGVEERVVPEWRE